MASLSCRFKLCTFDVTNTLLKFNANVSDVYTKAAKLYGVTRKPEEISGVFQHHFKTMNRNHPNFGQETGLNSENWWKQLIKLVLCNSSSDITDNQLNSISNYLYELYKREECWKVAPGAKTLLTNVKKQNITLGIISNFDERLEEVLTSTDLLPYFDFVLSSYNVKIAKPNKKIFDLALEHVCNINPSEALHIGDDVKLDYLAAKTAGWHALLIPNKLLTAEDLKMVNPHDIINNLDSALSSLLEVPK